jgi:ribosomal protein L16/L10AE
MPAQASSGILVKVELADAGGQDIRLRARLGLDHVFPGELRLHLSEMMAVRMKELEECRRFVPRIFQPRAFDERQTRDCVIINYV